MSLRVSIYWVNIDELFRVFFCQEITLESDTTRVQSPFLSIDFPLAPLQKGAISPLFQVSSTQSAHAGPKKMKQLFYLPRSNFVKDQNLVNS